MTALSAQLGTLITQGGRSSTVEWLDIAERAVTDTVAVLLAGARDPAVDMVGTAVQESGGGVRSLATGRWMSARSAALVDGTSAHALDYDDVDDSLIAHPSAVLVPALMAAGQQSGSSGEAILHAYLIGLETARAVGRALDIPGHYDAGWHPTATVGTLGAAAAVSALLGLEETRARHALGVAGSLACGSRQNFGTMTKPLHAGMAASNGLFAAYLGERGFTADPDQLDGRLGFLALYRGPGLTEQEVVSGTNRDVPIGLNLKLYPCCYATHAAVEAGTQLHRVISAGAEPSAIEVTVQSGGLAPLIHHRPADGTQAKFSIEYTVAAALLDGTVNLASFDDQMVRRQEHQQLLRKVTAVEAARHGRSESPAWFATVTARFADGESRSARVDNPIGHVSRPLSEHQLHAKFRDCLLLACDQVMDEPAIDEVFETVRGLREQRNVATVAARLAQVVKARTGVVA